MHWLKLVRARKHKILHVTLPGLPRLKKNPFSTLKYKMFICNTTEMFLLKKVWIWNQEQCIASFTLAVVILKNAINRHTSTVLKMVIRVCMTQVVMLYCDKTKFIKSCRAGETSKTCHVGCFRIDSVTERPPVATMRTFCFHLPQMKGRI